MSSPEEPTTYLNLETASVYLAKAIRDPKAELEWIYGDSPQTGLLTKPQFMRLLTHLKEQYPCVSETNTLDIRKQYVRVQGPYVGAIRCTIEGISDIREYCRTNDIEPLASVTYMEKTLYQDPKNPTLNYKSLRNAEYNHRLNLKQETPLEDSHTEVEAFRKSLKDSLKHFRYKKRFSFLTPDALFRIDLTAVKTSEYNFKTQGPALYRNFVDSGILRTQELFEIEVEYVGSELRPGTPLRAIDVYVNTMVASDGTVSDLTWAQTQKLGQNVFSQVVEVEVPGPEEIVAHTIPGEFEVPEPPHLAPGFNLNDPMTDIRYEYWTSSGQEWYLNALALFEKTLTFVRLRENTTATYPQAPEQVTYAEFTCVPDFTPEEIKEYQDLYPEDTFDWPPYLLIPVSEIQGSQVEPGTLSLSQLKETEAKRVLKTVITKILGSLDRTIGTLLGQIHDTDLFVSRKVRQEVLKTYKRITEQEGATRFQGPDPVTLTLREMVPEHPHTILQGYVVTEKADGVRAQLVIHQETGHLILGKKLGILRTGLRFETLQGVWILDGEYITHDKAGNPTRLFMIFDVYYAGEGGEGTLYPDHAYTYPWTASSKKALTRSRILEEFKRQVIMTSDGTSENPMTIGFKTYYEGPKVLKSSQGAFKNLSGMGKVCKKIFALDAKNEGYGYTIDGLIFMPMYFPVKSLTESPVHPIGGRWDVNYKWKPPEENTIDFKVVFEKVEYQGHLVDKVTSTTLEGEVVSCKQVSLIVGYNETDDPTSDFAWKVMTGHTSKPLKEIPFRPESESSDRALHLCHLPIVEGKVLCQRDGVELKDGMIVEMQYAPTQPEGAQWIPLRERADKKEPQYFRVANNVWDTIMNPVTLGMIQGKPKELQGVKESLGEATEAETHYYVAQEDTGLDGPLRKFHNYLKQRLISDVSSALSKKTIAVLDTSVGRGGDLKKYLGSDKEISFFLGLDISPDVNEAAKRYYTERMKKPKAMFLQYDTSQPIHTGEGCVGSETAVLKNHQLIDILYKNQTHVSKEYRKIDGIYRGLGETGFDLISSQFTLHYYFKDELTLRGYLQNLSDSCVKGGYFIGTCYDGMKVFQMLQERSVLEMTDDYEKPVYTLTKTYEIEDFTYHKDNKEAMFGQTIDVYMSSIGQSIQEYLVNFEMFVDMMTEYGFALAVPDMHGKHSGIFDSQSFSYQKGLGGFDQILSKLANLSSKDMGLKTYYSEALQMLLEENAGLRQLSVLNNWFIFQKQ